MLKIHCEQCDAVIDRDKWEELLKVLEDAGFLSKPEEHYCSIRCIHNRLLSFWENRNVCQ